MFTAWKFDPKDEHAVLQAQPIPFDPVTRRTSVVKACSSCRVRKLRCNGEKSGCQRCKAQGVECRYSDTGRRRRTGSSCTSTINSKSLDVSDTQETLTNSANVAPSEVSTSLSLSNEESQPPSTPQQERENPGSQEQLDLQHIDQDDLSWLESHPTTIELFADVNMSDNDLVDIDGNPFVDNLSGRDDSPDIVLGLASSSTCMLLQDNFLPTLRPPYELTNDESESMISVSQSNTTCHCLYRVLMVIDKLSVQDDSTVENSVDDLLVLHKEALSNGTAILGCTVCIERVENMLVLAMLIDKLSRLCHRIVHAPIKTPASSLSLGDYMVDSAEEYAVLISSLLGVQLRRLQTMAHRLHQISSRFQSDTLAHRLTVCSGCISRSLDKLRNMGR